jgi:hypothetical protein
LMNSQVSPALAKVSYKVFSAQIARESHATSSTSSRIR